MNSKKIIFLAIVIAIVAGGWYGYREYTRKVKDLSKVKAHVSIDDSGLIQVFEKNEAEANAQYLDKIIAVRGTVRTVEKDDKGYYCVILGKQNSMSSIRCSMDSVHQEEVAGIPAGSVITVKGACTGFNVDELLGSDVILNRCVLIE